MKVETKNSHLDIKFEVGDVFLSKQGNFYMLINPYLENSPLSKYALQNLDGITVYSKPKSLQDITNEIKSEIRSACLVHFSQDKYKLLIEEK